MPLNYRKPNNIPQNPNYLSQQQKKDTYKNYLAIAPIDSVAKKASVEKECSFKKDRSHEKVAITATTANKDHDRLSNYF